MLYNNNELILLNNVQKNAKVVKKCVMNRERLKTGFVKNIMKLFSCANYYSKTFAEQTFPFNIFEINLAFFF
jgi:hypothetical protein